MNLQEIIQKLELKLLTNPKDFQDTIPSGGYSSDLLSCVMAGAKSGNLWITLQAHINIVAVASLVAVATMNEPPKAGPSDLNQTVVESSVTAPGRLAPWEPT